MSFSDSVTTITGWLAAGSKYTGYFNLAIGLTNFILGRTATDPNKERYKFLCDTIADLRTEINQGLKLDELIEWSVVYAGLKEHILRLEARGTAMALMKPPGSDPHITPPVITDADRARFVAAVLDNNDGAEVDLQAIHDWCVGGRDLRPLFQAYYEGIGLGGMRLFFRKLQYMQVLGLAQILLAWELEGSMAQHAYHKDQLQIRLSEQYDWQLAAVSTYLADPALTSNIKIACAYSADGASDPDGLHERHQWTPVAVRLNYPGTGWYWFVDGGLNQDLLSMNPEWRGYNRDSPQLQMTFLPLIMAQGSCFQIQDMHGRLVTLATAPVPGLAHDPPFFYCTSNPSYFKVQPMTGDQGRIVCPQAPGRALRDDAANWVVPGAPGDEPVWNITPW